MNQVELPFPISFKDRVNENWWDDELWLELNEACNDPNDSEAVKDLNKLYMKWEHLSEEKRGHMNEAFIIICGWSFDTLKSRVDKVDEDADIST